MSGNNCADPVTCPDGNCVGCQNGAVWCQDPRCDPYCANCAPPPDHELATSLTIAVIILLLVAIIIIIWYTSSNRAK